MAEDELSWETTEIGDENEGGKLRDGIQVG